MTRRLSVLISAVTVMPAVRGISGASSADCAFIKRNENRKNELLRPVRGRQGLAVGQIHGVRLRAAGKSEQFQAFQARVSLTADDQMVVDDDAEGRAHRDNVLGHFYV